MQIAPFHRKFSSALLLLGALACLFSPAARAQIATLNSGQTINIEYGGPPSVYAGTGVIGNGGTTWNLSKYMNSVANLVDESNNVTTAACYGQQLANNSLLLCFNTLLNYYSSTKTNALPFVITNLPAGLYKVAVYGINAGWASDLTTFTIGGQALSVVNTSAGTNAFIQGNNYVIFTNVVVSNTGGSPNAIAGTYGPTIAGWQGAINGAQIQYLGPGTGQPPVAAPVVISPGVVYPGMTVTLSESPSGTGPFTYQWKFNGTNLPEGGAISGTTNGTLTLSNITTNQAGSYTVGITNGSGGVLSAPAVLQVSVTPDPLAGLITTPAPANAGDLASRLGLCGLEGYPLNNLNQVRSAGFSWMRYDARWADIETSTNVYAFSWVDSVQSAAVANGLKVLWILDYGNPLYSTNIPPTDLDQSALPIGPVMIQRFTNYVVALINHLPKGQRFEVWNEPYGYGFTNTQYAPAQYAALCNAVIPAIRAADPTAKVTITSLKGCIDWWELGAVFQAGFPGPGAVPDGIAMHTYLYPYQQIGGQGASDNGDPELLFTPSYTTGTPTYYSWPEFEAVKAQYNFTAPTWVTEGGYHLTITPPPDPLWQPRMVLRMILCQWAAGFPMQFLYVKDGGSSSFLGNTGSVAAVTELATLAKGRTFTGYTVDASIPPTGQATNLNLLRMEGTNDIVYAVWMRTNTYTLSVPAGTPGVTMTGAPFTANGSVVVNATSGPVYLTFFKSFVLTVANGTGGGSYTNGTVVAITAGNAPPGERFANWVINSGNPNINDTNAAGTTLTMPATNVMVTATYTLLPSPPTIASLALAGTNFIMAWTNGTPNATNYLLASANLALPLTNWTRLATNVLDAQGDFTITNGMNPDQPWQFYRLQLP